MQFFVTNQELALAKEDDGYVLDLWLWSVPNPINNKKSRIFAIDTVITTCKRTSHWSWYDSLNVKYETILKSLAPSYS